jgi:hypothetical protein
MGDMGQFMPFFAGQFEERLFTDLTTMPLFFLVNFQNMPKDMTTFENGQKISKNLKFLF